MLCLSEARPNITALRGRIDTAAAVEQPRRRVLPHQRYDGLAERLDQRSFQYGACYLMTHLCHFPDFFSWARTRVKLPAIT